MNARLSWAAATLGATVVMAPAAYASQPAPTCGETVTHSVRLTANLACAPAPALTIGASGITIDLNGHTIEANAGNAAVIVDDGYGQVRIRNGSIFSVSTTDVELQDANRVRIAKVQAYGTLGVGIDGGSDDVVAHTGMNGDGTDISSGGTQGLRIVDDSLVNGGGEASEGALWGDDAVIRGNTFEGVDRYVTVKGDGNLVADNNGAIEVSDGARNRVIDNTVKSEQASAGITVDASAAQTLVRSNIVDGAFGDGIYVLDPTARIVANTTNDNQGYGIDAVSGDTGGRNQANDNNFLTTGVPGVQCLNIACITTSP